MSTLSNNVTPNRPMQGPMTQDETELLEIAYFISEVRTRLPPHYASTTSGAILSSYRDRNGKPLPGKNTTEQERYLEEATKQIRKKYSISSMGPISLLCSTFWATP